MGSRWTSETIQLLPNDEDLHHHVMITIWFNMIMLLKVGQVPSRPWFPDLRLPILRGSPSWARKPRTVWLLRCCSRCCSRCCFPKSNFPQILAKFCSCWWNQNITKNHQRLRFGHKIKSISFSEWTSAEARWTVATFISCHTMSLDDGFIWFSNVFKLMCWSRWSWTLDNSS